MGQSPPERVQQRFCELERGASRLFSSQDEPQLFMDLELEAQGSVWLVKVRTNEYPIKVFELLGTVVDEINREEDFSFLLTMERPK